MNQITRFAAPIAIALAAFGVNAQTVETDYPLVTVNGQTATAAQPLAAAAPTPQAGVYLVQSNAEGPKVAEAFAKPSSLTRDEVRAGARVRTLQAPDSNV